jgi:16S rRNA (guanine527-N7)-methyltransferase
MTTIPPDATPGSAAQSSEKKERAPFELPNREALDASVITPPDDFLSRADQAGISFEPGDVERLGFYLGYLLDANERMNLTGIRDAGEAWTRHILDALTLLAPLSELADGAAIVDIGSGGGVPGIPLAIVLPGVRFSLLEATTKKAHFLTQVAAKLDLGNVEVLNDRAEQAAAEGSIHRARFDAVVARAVGPLRVVAELAVPFGKVGALILLVKGERADEELSDARRALHSLHTTHAGTIETPTGRIVVLEKRRQTPRMYPRKVGDPKRSPL